MFDMFDFGTGSMQTRGFNYLTVMLAESFFLRVGMLQRCKLICLVCVLVLFQEGPCLWSTQRYVLSYGVVCFIRVPPVVFYVHFAFYCFTVVAF